MHDNKQFPKNLSLLHCTGSPPVFAIFTKGDNFRDFLFASLENGALPTQKP